MGRRDFEKGMAAGAKPFEAMYRDVSKGLEHIADKIENYVNGQTAYNNEFADGLDDAQRKQYFQNNTVVDISYLQQGDREILLDLLLTLATTEENVNDNQKIFINSVRRYLNKGNESIRPLKFGALTEINWSVIERIKGTDEAKAIAQAIMEFLFLGYGNHEDYLDEYEDLFDYFPLSNKNLKDIIAHIDNIYHATGMQGIAENYGYTPTKYDKFNINEEYGARDDLAEIRITNDYNFTQLQDNTFENKKVVFENPITIKNKDLTFKNCRLCFDINAFHKFNDELQKKFYEDRDSQRKDPNAEGWKTVFGIKDTEEIFEKIRKGETVDNKTINNVANNRIKSGLLSALTFGISGIVDANKAVKSAKSYNESLTYVHYTPCEYFMELKDSSINFKNCTIENCDIRFIIIEGNSKINIENSLISKDTNLCIGNNCVEVTVKDTYFNLSDNTTPDCLLMCDKEVIEV